jgi:hypothetical protein
MHPDTTTGEPRRSTRSTESTSSESASIASSSGEETLDLTYGAKIVTRGRETKWHKAMRLLIQGRLRVLRVDVDFIAAECRGDSGEVYRLGWRGQRWTCSCPAMTDCSHLAALWAVCAVSRR